MSPRPYPDDRRPNLIIVRPQIGNTDHLDYVVLGPIPRIFGQPYGTKLLRQPTTKQVCRRAQIAYNQERFA